MNAYDAARERAVVAMRSDRTLLRMYGRDPVKMLQGLITNDVAGAPDTRAVLAAVLTPKGKMVAEVRVVRRGADLLVETAAGAAEALSAHLKKFVPPLFARFEDVSAAWKVTGVYGPHARDVVQQATGITLPAAASEDDVIVQEEVMCIATSYLGVPGFDIIAPADDADALHDRIVAAGAVHADADVVETLRIEAGSPRWGAELDDNVIPLEAGLRTRAISENKGCYTGQEVIIRILHRGHVNWILRGLRLGSAAPPAPGTELVNADGKKAARITSAVQSPLLGETIALAYVRREVEPGTALQMQEGASAVVTELPFAR